MMRYRENIQPMRICAMVFILIMINGCYSVSLLSTSILPKYVSSDDWEKPPAVDVQWPKITFTMPVTQAVSDLWIKPIVKNQNGIIAIKTRWWPYELPREWTYDLRKLGFKEDSVGHIEVLWENPNGTKIKIIG